MFCETVKEFLSQKGIGFVERDVTVDKAAIAELEELGFMTTPVTVIDGEVIVGFDRQRLDGLLASQKRLDFEVHHSKARQGRQSPRVVPAQRGDKE